jgi:hypothetical protein
MRQLNQITAGKTNVIPAPLKVPLGGFRGKIIKL